MLYSQQVSIFMKQPCSTHNRFCSTIKKEKCPCEARTHDLDVISMLAISIPKKEVVFVRLELMTFTLQHDALPHRSCPVHTTGAKSKQTFNIAQKDILRTWLCEACSGSPQKCFCDGDNKLVLVYPHTYELPASFFLFPWQPSDRDTFTNIGHNGNTLIVLTNCGRIMTKGTTWHKNWKIINAQSPFTILEVPYVSF